MSERQRRLRARAGHDQAAHAIVGQQFGAGRQPPAGIDDDPRRLRAGDAPHRELGIVGQRRADADHHRIDQRPQPVQMGESGRPVDVVGMAGFGRDPAVQRLADLGDHHQVVDPAMPQAARKAPPRAPAAGRSAPETPAGTGVQESDILTVFVRVSAGACHVELISGRRREMRDDGTLTCHNSLLPLKLTCDQWLRGMVTPSPVFVASGGASGSEASVNAE